MIGTLRHKLLRLIEVRVPDAGGGAAISWEEAGELWASVDLLTPLRDRSGDRRAFRKRIAAEVRADHGFSEGEVVRYEARDYEIVSIESDDQRQRRHTLIGEEIGV